MCMYKSLHSSSRTRDSCCLAAHRVQWEQHVYHVLAAVLFVGLRGNRRAKQRQQAGVVQAAHHSYLAPRLCQAFARHSQHLRGLQVTRPLPLYKQGPS